MNPQRILTIIHKEWTQAFRTWSSRLAVFLPPFVVTLLAIRLLAYLHSRMDPERYPAMLDYYLVIFMAMPLIGTAKVAVTGMMEDKAARSLEPLLVTPLTSGELLAGKFLAAVTPATLVSWVAYGIFTTAMSHAGFTQSPIFGSFQGMVWRFTIFVIAPLLAVLIAAVAFLISVRMKDAHNAMNSCNEISAGITLLIFAGVGAAAYRHYAMSPGLLMEISAGVVLLNALTFLMCVKLFQRETVLFEWK
jgi:ABC-type Na+ efflux pump permease subunit